MNCTLVLTRLMKLSQGLVGLQQKLISEKIAQCIYFNFTLMRSTQFILKCSC